MLKTPSIIHSMRISIRFASIMLISIYLIITKHYIAIYDQLNIHLRLVNGIALLYEPLLVIQCELKSGFREFKDIVINDESKRYIVEYSEEIEKETAGVRVIPVFNKVNPKTNKTENYYESDYLIGNITGVDKSRWNIYNIDDDQIQEYLLEDEIKSSQRDDHGNTLAGDNCHRYNPCCLSSIPAGFIKNNAFYKRNTERIHQLWTWYMAPHNRSLFNIVDAFDLVIDNFEKKKIPKEIRSEAHIVLVGDSLSQQVYLGFICSLQRTLGARVMFHDYRLISVQNGLKIRGQPMSKNVPYKEMLTIFEINSTSKGKGIRRMKFTYVHLYKPFYDNIRKLYTGAVLKTLCGIPFNALNAKGNQTVEINPKKDNVDVILLNHGVHFLNARDYLQSMNETFNTFSKCQKAGIHTIYRDSFAQHFRYGYGGEFSQDQFKGPVAEKELPQRTMALSNTSWCAPNIFMNKEMINWRYRLFKDKFDVLELNNNTICHRDNPNKFDFIPGYATTSYYWNAFLTTDCTHFMYSPGLYLPHQDGFYKAIFRSTLKPGECKPLPDNSNSPFISGPKGLRMGIMQNHDKRFLPVVDAKMPTTPRLSKAATLLDPLIN